jgi:hypothetical protein
MRDKRIHNCLGACLTVLGLSVAMAAAGAPAQDQVHRGGSEPYAVLAHINVPGSPATQMRLQEENGHEYLYLVRGSGTGFTVVDVTKPRTPDVVNKVTLPAGTSTKGLDVAGSTLAITEEGNGGGNPRQIQSESIQLFNTEDPANPRLLQNFNGVTSVLPENGRHLVYIATNQGLYIVRRPVKATTHPCTSSDDMAAMPECY